MKPQGHGTARAAGPLARGLVCVLSGALLTALWGCAPLPPLPAQAPPWPAVPAQWQAVQARGQAVQAQGQPPLAPAAVPTDLQAWWLQFGDAQLSHWVQLADQGSPRVVVAQAAWREALALRDLAAASRWPQLGLQAATGRDTQGRGDGQQVARHVQAGLEASWTPDVTGGAGSALAAAEAVLLAQQARWAGVRLQVAVDVALACIGLRAQAAQLQLAQRTVASQRQTLQIADWRQQAGLVSALDTDQARTALAQTEALLPALQTAGAQSRHRLAELAGLPPGSGPWADEPAANGALSSNAATDVPLAQAPLTLASPADTLRQRVDLVAAGLDEAAARARVDEARALQRPSLALTAALGLRTASWHALGDGAALLGSLLASVRLTLFDAGAGQARVQAQLAAWQQAQAEHQALWLGALREVEDALVGLQGERARSLAVQTAAALADRAATLARERFASGLVDLGTVLDTQRTAYSLQDAAVLARADLARGQVRLFQTLGGGVSAQDTPRGPPALSSAERP